MDERIEKIDEVMLNLWVELTKNRDEIRDKKINDYQTLIDFFICSDWMKNNINKKWKI